MRWLAVFFSLVIAASAQQMSGRPSPRDPVTPYDHYVEYRLKQLESGGVADTRINLRVETNTGQYATFYAPQSVTLASSSGVLRATTSPVARPLNAHPTVWFEPPANTETDPAFTNWLASDPLDPYLRTNHVGDAYIAGSYAVVGSGSMEYPVSELQPTSSGIVLGETGELLVTTMAGALVKRDSGGTWADTEVVLPPGFLEYGRSSFSGQALCASASGSNVYGCLYEDYVPGATSVVHSLEAGVWVDAGLTGRYTHVSCSAGGELLVAFSPLYAGLAYRTNAGSGWVVDAPLQWPVAVVPDGSGFLAYDPVLEQLMLVPASTGVPAQHPGSPEGEYLAVASSYDGSTLLAVVAPKSVYEYTTGGGWRELDPLVVFGHRVEGPLEELDDIGYASAFVSYDGLSAVVGVAFGMLDAISRRYSSEDWGPIVLNGGKLNSVDCMSWSPDLELMLYAPLSSRVWVLDYANAGRLLVPGSLILKGYMDVHSELVSNKTFRTLRRQISAENLLTPYAKFHHTNGADLVFANTTAWHDVTFDFAPTSENSLGITLNGDAKTIELGFDGHIQIDGCLRCKWNGANDTVAWLASRIVYSTDGWSTTNEARCLQSFISRERQESEVAMLPFNGSLTVSTNMQVRLQGRVSDTNLVLSLNEVFDNPAAASINLFAVGAEPQ